MIESLEIQIIDNEFIFLMKMIEIVKLI